MSIDLYNNYMMPCIVYASTLLFSYTCFFSDLNQIKGAFDMFLLQTIEMLTTKALLK